MNEEKIKEIVYKNFEDGFHCAESIANAINELFPEKADNISKVTSGFCGGIGRCRQDVCGALSGGVITLGAIYGRQKGGDDISKLVSLSTELRQQFIEEFKTTVCKDVIENMNNMPRYNDCKDLTAKTTWNLYRLIAADSQ